MNQSKIVSIFNFFEDFDYLSKFLKTIPVYSNEEYNKNFNAKQTWPGFRSQDLSTSCPPIICLIKSILKKNNIDIQNCTIEAYTHLRLQEDQEKDWIHEDSYGGCFLTCLIYLSDTKIDSGTGFYLNKDKNSLFTKIGFIKNSALLFSSNILHSSLLNYGKSIEDGRLTLNIFFYNKNA
jgi:hypothetical protein